MGNKIGAVIRAKRVELSYTQEELAALVGVTPSTIGQIERGDIYPKFETLEKLTLTLAIDANAYFYDSNYDNNEAGEYARILEQMPPYKRKIAQGIIKQIYKDED